VLSVEGEERGEKESHAKTQRRKEREKKEKEPGEALNGTRIRSPTP
jgi:hypothetical protein